MTSWNLNELIKHADEVAKEHGHILSDWKKWGRRHSAWGSNNDTHAYAQCQLCKIHFSVECGEELELPDSDCPININKTMVLSDEGIAVTTWGYCGICGRKLSSDEAMIRGTCSVKGCNRDSAEKVGKDNKFYNLSKLPKEKEKNFPILNHVLVVVHDGIMDCYMWKDFYADDGKLMSVSFNNVSGKSYLCVPRNTFVDLMQLVNGENVTITADYNTCQLVVSGEGWKNVIKGIDSAEFPMAKDK